MMDDETLREIIRSEIEALRQQDEDSLFEAALELVAREESDDIAPSR